MKATTLPVGNEVKGLVKKGMKKSRATSKYKN